jgi:transglutaminase-like putative cysteine protease
MLISIRHTSRYHYDGPILYAVQRLRLWPQSVAGQTVHSWDVKMEGVAPEVSYVDGFGNRTELVRHIREHQEIVLTAAGIVETEDRAGVFGSVQGFAPIWLFDRVTPLTEPGEGIRALAATLPEDAKWLAKLHQLMDTIHDRLTFKTDATTTFTTAEDALGQGQGVCQDYAHIFISAARVAGIPARYVSGYLMRDDIVEQTAGHAWAEAHVDGLGWVGFDATNNACPNDRYVRVGCGLDYRDAAPVSGMRIGQAAESLAVQVNVEQ